MTHSQTLNKYRTKQKLSSKKATARQPDTQFDAAMGQMAAAGEQDDIELEDKFLKIVSYGKRSVAKYFYAEPTVIVSLPAFSATATIEIGFSN